MAVGDQTEQNYLPKKKKSETEDDKRRKNIVPGSLLKAVVRPGGGDSSPVDGDQVIYHCTVRTLDGVVVESTRSECGGRGVPIRDVLGKSKMILGLLEGIPTMHKGEIAMFKMKPEMHYAEKDCPVSAPGNFPKDDELHFETELLDFFKAKIASEDLGVVKKILNEGEGWESPREPYEVKARISAKSGDGQVIFSHTEEPYFFTFGKSEVPKGLEIGIGTMARKEKAVIYVRKQYLTESPLMHIDQDREEVHFEVELVHFIQVRDMLGDGRLIKRRIQDGRGEFPMDCPLQDSRLSVHYKGMLLDEEKTVFYDSKLENNDQPLEFSSGEGLVPEGFEMCTRLMLPGEIALVTCPPDYAYDKFPRPPGVPEGAHVQWEIELLGFETPKDWTGLNFQSIMDEAEKIRSTGNRLFKEGKFELAKAKYEKVLREFNHVNPQDDDEGKIFGDTRNMLHLNVAACLLKLGEWRKSIETCNKVLEAKPGHVKGLYRRGMAYIAGGEYDDARNDFNMMIKVDKSSEADATAALLKLKQKEQEAENKARKQFKGLFDKKPGEITEVGTEIREESKTIEEVDETKDIDEDETQEEEEGTTTVSTERKKKWSEKGWPFLKNVMLQIGMQLGVVLIGILIFQFVNAKFT
ncbi:PREDICTED: peptidyl-prolyl cis-trans isomerase PASTICCINO1 [Camelina sativa]|uniref:peptidylprolyl isomerase n=1 Tax=Camelina sativa TaxID=90675 RepID=A0ABM0YPX7_CAMSA|nr:PREDICTED: peptidyl-prolyl cis-trans isomerase PASTICCINO1 [Camelina sativa]